jgi:tellurite resistance protein TerC
VTVSPWVWWVSIAALVLLAFLDFVTLGRRGRELSYREAARWLGGYGALVAGFGIAVWFTMGSGHAVRFYTGVITGYALSVDLLFLFVVVLGRWGVPHRQAQMVLLLSVALVLLVRGVLITAGAAALRVPWASYLLAAMLLLLMGWRLAMWRRCDVDSEESIPTWRERVARRVPWLLAPAALVALADLLPAVESVTVLFGITAESYLVFAVSAVVLVGLRLSYPLLSRSLEVLTHASVAQVLILGYVAVACLLDALAGNSLDLVNGGRPVTWAPRAPAWLSFVVVAAILLVTTAASRLQSRHDQRSAAGHVVEWMAVAVSSGVLGNAAWAGAQAATRGLRRKHRRLAPVTEREALLLARAAVEARCHTIDVTPPQPEATRQSLYQSGAGNWIVELRDTASGRRFLVRIPAGRPDTGDVTVEVHVPPNSHD